MFQRVIIGEVFLTYPVRAPEIIGFSQSEGADQYLSGFLSSWRKRHETAEVLGPRVRTQTCPLEVQHQNRTFLRHAVSDKEV